MNKLLLTLGGVNWEHAPSLQLDTAIFCFSTAASPSYFYQSESCEKGFSGIALQPGIGNTLATLYLMSERDQTSFYFPESLPAQRSGLFPL